MFIQDMQRPCYEKWVGGFSKRNGLFLTKMMVVLMMMVMLPPILVMTLTVVMAGAKLIAVRIQC